MAKLLAVGYLASIGLALATACGRDSGPAAQTPALPIASTDPLWKLAPAELKFGVVAGDGSLAALHDGMTAALAGMAAAGGPVAVHATEVRQGLVLHGIDVTDAAAVKAAGIDLSRGIAAFSSADGIAVVAPIVDRAAFVARVGGTVGDQGVITFEDGATTCRPLGDRFACAERATALDGLGKGDAMTEIGTWPKASRGHIEAWVPQANLAAMPALGGLEAARGLRAAVQLERGAVTVSVHLVGTPVPLLAPLVGAARSPLIAPLLASNPAGGIVLDGSAATAAPIAMLAGQLPETARVGEVSLRALAASVRGDLVGWAEHGAPLRGQLAFGLNDEAPARALVRACALPMAVPGLTVQRADDRCKLAYTPPELPQTLNAELWVEGGALRFGLGAYRATSKAPPVDAIGRRLLGDHQVALWGAGSVLDAPLVAQLRSLPPGDAAATVTSFLFVAAHLAEFGLGFQVAADGFHGVLRLRTTWGNPPALIAELEPLIGAFARGEADVTAKFHALATRFPESRFAADLAAGPGGLMPLAGGTGTLAAIAIPAFVKYIKKSKTAEARQVVRQLHRGAALALSDPAPGKSGLPRPSAGPTPPLGACCISGEKCAPDATQWDAEPWRSLHFSINDPHYYSYQYDVAADGKSFTARAFGDLDCDGIYSTFSLVGSDDPTAPPAELVVTQELE